MTTRGQAIRLAALVAVGAWTVAALTPPLAEADLVATQWLQQYASPALDVAFSIFTVAGNVEVTAVLAGLIGVALIRTGRARLGIGLWAVFTGGSVIEWMAKHWLPHPGVPESLQRPEVHLLPYLVRTPYSYLSGHAFRTLLLAAVASWMWAQSSNRSRRLLPPLLGVAVALTGVALVYLGDHWASEVIGGYLLAVLGLVLLQEEAHTRGWKTLRRGPLTLK